MTLEDRLHTLRSALPNCQVVAFGDAQARLILKASHASLVPREVLDSLCAEAAECFATADRIGATPAQASEAVVLTDEESRIYLRAQNRADFLCIVSQRQSNLDLAVTQGTHTLQRISGAE
ncbi:MAG: hypothetical protein GY767_08865 [Shimia sp.]|nr:hypothetical protein [Shimia sp.]MCP4826243.1 hypothetical protein [Shimia sp.]